MYLKVERAHLEMKIVQGINPAILPKQCDLFNNLAASYLIPFPALDSLRFEFP